MDQLPGLTLVACLIALLAAPLADAQEPPFTAIVTGDKVNVRSGASTNYYPVGQLERGDLVRVREFLYGWAVIDPPPGTFSYISADFVDLADDGESGTVTGDGVRVRAPSPRGPSKGYSYKIQMQLDEGETVRVLGEEDGWYRIVPPEGAALYVHRDYIRPATRQEIAAAQAQAPAPEAEAAPETEGEAEPAEPEAPAEPLTPTTPERAMAEAVAPEPTDEPEPAEPMQPAEVDVEAPEPAITAPTAEAEAEAERAVEQPATAAVAEAEPEATETEPETADEAPEAGEPDVAANEAETETEAETEAARRRGADEALAALEVRFSEISKRPLPRQPIDELLGDYRQLAASPHLAPESEVLVDTRIELLETRQQLKQALTDLRMVEEDEEELEPVVREPARQYTAVGRLMASTVYTGERMPLLYRLVDPLSGLTVAYIRPEPRQNLTDLLGQYVGVIGQSRYDTGLKLNIIEVEQADELAAQPDRG